MSIKLQINAFNSFKTESKQFLFKTFFALVILLGLNQSTFAGGCTTPGVPGAPNTTAISCDGFTANWTASVPAPNNSYQVQVSTNTTFTALVLNNNYAIPIVSLTVTGAIPGTTYYWRVRAITTGGGGCQSAYTAYQTVVIPNPSPAAAGPNQTLPVCNTSTTMAATAPAGGFSGTWTVVAGTATITTPTSPTTTVTGLLLNATATLRWTVNNGVPLTCETTDDVDITTVAGPGCAVYCIPSINAAYYPPTNYIRRVSFVGTLQDTDNPSSYDTTAPYGYENFTGLATKSIQAQGQGVNIYMETVASGYYKAWVDWNNDGDFADAGEDVYDVGGIAQSSTTFGFVVPPAAAPGNYRVRVRFSGRNAGMGGDAGFGWNSCTTNVAYYGETEDYEFTVVASCDAIITSVTNGTTCGVGTVDLSAVGSGSPSEYRWYTSEFGGAPVATTATGSWTTPSIGVTTDYWVTCFNGCESLTRTKVTANVSPLATITFTPSVPEVCGENNVLSLTAAGDVQQTYLINEAFEAGLGVMTNQNIVSNPAENALTQWQTQSSTFVPAQQTWYPAIASGLNGNDFAMATSDVGPVTTHNAILSPVVNTNTYLDLTLSFDIFHSRYYVDGTNLGLEYVTVDVSTNGGGAWTEIERITTDLGYGTRFINKTYDLSAYIDEPNFRVRVRYYAVWCDGLAIDNFKLFGNLPLNTAFDWTAASPVDAYQDAACTIPYVSGTPIVTVYVKPNLTQLEEPTYDFTATAILSNGCSVSQNVSINNKTSVWKGTSSNDWNNPNNWNPVGVPDINTCVVIPDVTSTNPSNILGAGYDAFGRTLQVKNLGDLQLLSGNTLTIQDYVDVTAGGTFNIENSASLIQVNNVANTGVIDMKRTATAGLLDYVYWSTPVAGFDIGSISGTLRYIWNPTINNGGTYASNFGNWTAASGGMTTGRGYIVRGSSGTTNFNGVPNNGNISMPITRSTYNGGPYAGPTATLVTADDDNWNLIGNPYPSALDAVDFLAANSNISGFVKIWTHNTLPVSAVDPFYEDYQLNYTTADYITYNNTGGTQSGYDGKIGAGQGFFVLMNNGAATPGNVVFNNTMRSNTHRNDQFYRSENGIEKNRIWLDIISPSNASITTLVGYISNATNNLDNEFDAIAQGVKSNFEIYSIAESQELIIQGRSLPFNQDDEVTLGVSIPQNGIYTIAISNVDGLFSDTTQKIYLEDKQLGIIHDLRTAPYTFTGTVGRDENRFVLLYNSSRLSQDDVSLTNNILVSSNDNVTIHSSSQNIASIEVHDLLGRVIKEYNNIDSKEFMLTNLEKNNTTLLLRVKLNNGVIVDKKVIF